MKNKLRKYKESQASNRKNQEISLRYKSQINDIFTEMQILRSQLDDSKDVQKKQDELIESLKLEIDINSNKAEKIVSNVFRDNLIKSIFLVYFLEKIWKWNKRVTRANVNIKKFEN